MGTKIVAEQKGIFRVICLVRFLHADGACQSCKSGWFRFRTGGAGHNRAGLPAPLHFIEAPGSPLGDTQILQRVIRFVVYGDPEAKELALHYGIPRHMAGYGNTRAVCGLTLICRADKGAGPEADSDGEGRCACPPQQSRILCWRRQRGFPRHPYDAPRVSAIQKSSSALRLGHRGYFHVKYSIGTHDSRKTMRGPADMLLERRVAAAGGKRPAAARGLLLAPHGCADQVLDRVG